MKEIHAYMSFTYPVDPAVFRMMPDMDLSYALASTLVEWSDAKQITTGIAESWTNPDDRSYQLRIKTGLQWSDGSPVTAQEIRASLLGGMQAHPEDLRSLANIIDKIECPSDRDVLFRLKMPANQSGLLKKLTEPNYGIVNLNKGGKPDLSKTTGPFFISKQSKDELTLQVNRHWHHYQPRVADEIVVRRPPTGIDLQTILFHDPWPTIAKGVSITPSEVRQRYEREGYALWSRPIDKVYLFTLGKVRKGADHQALLRFLRAKIDIKNLTRGMDGYQETDQLFPVGYTLHDEQMSCQPTKPEALPEVFKKRPVEIAVSTPWLFPTLVENIKTVVTKLTGIPPKIIPVEVNQTTRVLDQGEFDLYAVIMGLADPDIEGVMSFYFEGNGRIIQSTPENDYVAQLDHARGIQDHDAKIQKMREIVSAATCQGMVLPLFHLASLGIGRPGIDFSEISSTEESIPLSKIRFRSEAK